MDYDEIKLKVAEYMESQSKLLPSQKILKNLLFILRNSRRYADICNELVETYGNNVEVLMLAESFFVDCSIVFEDQSILKLAILLDDSKKKEKTISIEKFFNVLNGADVKKFGANSSFINSYIVEDKAELKKIQIDFINYKTKRDKEIAHSDLSHVSRDSIVSLDMKSLIEIQTRVYDLMLKYFELVDLRKPSCLTDSNQFSLQTGLGTLKSVLIRGLTELNFQDHSEIQQVIKFTEMMRICNPRTSDSGFVIPE